MSVIEASEKIEQLVFDENKIVTYKVLSRELSVHVNKAKQILNQFITDFFSKGKNDISVCYAISGLQKYNGYQIHKLAVVPKHQLEKVKKDFLVLSSVHVYSIQKTTNLNDCVLFASDSAATKDQESCSIFSAIRHPNIKIQVDRVIKNVAQPDNKGNKPSGSKIAPKMEPKVENPAKKKHSVFTTWQKKDTAIKNGSSESKTTVENKSEDSVSADTTKNDSSNGQKPNSKQNPTESLKAQEKKNNNQIKNMFSKQAERVSVKPIVRTPSPEKTETDIKVTQCLAKTLKDKQLKPPSKSQDKAKSKRTRKTNKHELSESESDGELKKPKKKKHKRIVMADTDSESESEEERDKAQRNLLETESPTKLDSTPMSEEEEDPIPPTPPIQARNGKCKKLKFVNKTFEDDEGFLVTKRVKEYVSASEDSESETPDKKDDKSSKTPPKPEIKLNLINKKQASLTGFFKRK